MCLHINRKIESFNKLAWFVPLFHDIEKAVSTSFGFEHIRELFLVHGTVQLVVVFSLM